MSYADAGPSGIRRFELFTGAGVRRKWTRDEKAAIIAESYAGVESVCAVAKRHGLLHTQLFTWRRDMRRGAAGVALPAAIAPEPLFVPAVIEPEPLRTQLDRQNVDVGYVFLLLQRNVAQV